MRGRAKLAGLILLGATQVGCGDLGMCGNEIRSATKSPSGDLKAVIFNRNCGATTGFNTQLSIIDAADVLPDDPGNVLIVDDTAPIEVTWKSDKVLTVSGSISSRISKQENHVNGVDIEYAK